MGIPRYPNLCMLEESMGRIFVFIGHSRHIHALKQITKDLINLKKHCKSRPRTTLFITSETTDFSLWSGQTTILNSLLTVFWLLCSFGTVFLLFNYHQQYTRQMSCKL